MSQRKKILVGLISVSMFGLAQAQVGAPPMRHPVPPPGTQRVMPPPTTAAGAGMDREDRRDEMRDAQEQIQDAVQVVQHMKQNPQLTQALARAQGVFIVTAFGRAALGVGVQGGEGVLITKQGNSFANPVFYNMGGLTLGPQAGISGGPMAFLLMTPKAVAQFRSNNNFSLSASAGITVAPWSAKAMAATGKLNDVYVWTGTKGLYAGANVGIEGIVPDNEANRAYYANRQVTPADIIGGRVQNPNNDVLAMVLAV